MKKEEVIEKLKRWIELDNMKDLTKNPKYWKEGKGLTKEGWKKRLQIEEEQNKILKEIGLSLSLIHISEPTRPY